MRMSGGKKSLLSRRQALGAIGAMAAGCVAPRLSSMPSILENPVGETCGKSSQDRSKIIRGKGPNILMIMADQLRADWMGCAGADWVKTPNLDALLARGVLFTRAACNFPLCAPSRSSLASGLRPSEIDVLSNNDFYPVDVPTYYQTLRKSGYRVGMVGKSDLHKQDHWEGINGDRPIMYHLGFTDPYELEGKETAASRSYKPLCPYTHFLAGRGLLEKFREDYTIDRKKYPRIIGAESVLPLDAYEDVFIGEYACRFLESVSTETPWHYYVSFVGPHSPWDAPREYLDLYQGAEMPEAIRVPEQKERFKREDLELSMRHYAAMTTLIDDYVGKMTDVLKRRGLFYNTVIIFCSDHGEMLGDHGRFAKNQLYESSVRIPLIISGAGIKARGKNEALVELYDLAPTCLDIALAEPLTRMTAKSLMPVLKGQTDSVRSIQISERKKDRMVFDGRFKAIVDYNGNPVALFDLTSDPRELKNIVRKEKTRALELARALMKQLAGETSQISF